MAVLGSLFFNRTLKQFLDCEDLDSKKAQDLIAKIKDSANESLGKILETIPEAPAAHAEVLKRICEEQSDKTEEELFKSLDNDSTNVRATAASILSQSTRLNPSRLLKRMQDSDTSKTEIIDILEFQSKNLKPELMINNALKLDKSNAERLIRVAANSEQPLDTELVHIEPDQIDSPNVKIALLRFLGGVPQADVAPLIVKFLQDGNKTVEIEALKALKNMEVEYDASILLPALDGLPDIEKDMALEVIAKQITPQTVHKLAPWTTTKSDNMRELFIDLLLEHLTPEGLEKFLVKLDKQEWWGKDQASKVLINNGSKELFRLAGALVDHESEFVSNVAQQLAALSDDPENLEKLAENALHENWQVREKALEALGRSGNRDSLNLLKEVIQKYPESAVSVIRAVRSLGFSKGLEVSFAALKMSEAQIQREALECIGTLATKGHAGAIRDKLLKVVPKLQPTVRDTAGEVVFSITEKFALPELEIDTSEYFETRLIKLDKDPELTMMVPKDGPIEATQVVQFQNIEELKEGDLWMDRYRIKKEIGRGAMGRVMLAEDEMVGEELILKFMHPELTADGPSRERFLREVKYSRKVSHPNVIRIHDMLFKDNLSAISMEFFKSRGIDELLKENKIYDAKEGLEILVQVSDGMSAAHNQQVIHRDLKPSNILMDDHGLVKVVDFGIASASSQAESTLTKTGLIIGTPAYLSPERAKGQEADERCDIYALAIIAYYMFSGQLPFKGEPMSLLFQHIEGGAKPVHQMRDDSFPIEVSRFVEKMMANKAENRMQSMDEVSEGIRDLLKQL